MILNGKNISVLVNSAPIFAQSCSINAQTPKEEFYLISDRDPRSTFSTQVYQCNTSLNYYITGADPLKAFIQNENDRINLNIGGFEIVSGVLESYSLDLDVNSYLNATANIRSYQNVTGGITLQSSKVANFNPIKWYNCVITGSGIDNQTLTGISSFRYSYNSEIIPRFFIQSGTGVNYFTTTDILFNQKSASLNLTADNIDISKLQDQNYLQLSLDIKDDNQTVIDRLNIYGNVTEKSVDIGINTNLSNSLSLIQTNLYEPPIIQSYPSNITPDNLFTINGSQFSNVTKVLLGNKECNIISNSDTEIIARAPADLISGSLKVIGFGGEDSDDNTTFSFLNPIIVGSDSTTGFIGSYVTINGTNFDTVNNVYFGNNSANFDNFVGVYDDVIRAVVPNNFQSGRIIVQSTQRNVSGVSFFNYKTPPIITSFSPQTGIPNTLISITGSAFYDLSQITVNGINAGYSLVNSLNINVTIPEGNTRGPISISTSNGFSTTSNAIFQPELIISGLTPNSGKAGITILVSGINFNTDLLFRQDFQENIPTYLVSFNGTPTGFRFRDDGRLEGEVPSNATSGPFNIYGPDGNIYYSTGHFTKLPEDIYIPTGINDNPIYPQVFYSGSNPHTYQILSITGNLNNVTGIRLSGVGTFLTYPYFAGIRWVSTPGVGRNQGYYENFYNAITITGNDNTNQIINIGSGQITGSLSGSPGITIFNIFNSKQIKEDINFTKIQVYLPVNIYSTNLGGNGAGTGFGCYEVRVLGRFSEQVISGNSGEFPYSNVYVKIRK